eukprot:COSAG01_NODE_9968_length_2288_cov_39.585199_1_plen_216_part_10
MRLGYGLMLVLRFGAVLLPGSAPCSRRTGEREAGGPGRTERATVLRGGRRDRCEAHRASRTARWTQPSARLRASFTAFMAPTFHMGHRYRIAIHVERKPGRMCYFIGVAPRRFDPDAGQAAIRESSYSLETLAASLHAVDRPCMVKGPPTFHQGSVVTMEVDLRNARSTLRFEGLASGAVREMQLHTAPSSTRLAPTALPHRPPGYLAATPLASST